MCMAGPDSSSRNEEAGARQSTGLDSSLKEKEIEAIHLCFTQEVQSEYSTRDLSFPTHYRVGAPGGSAELAEVWAPDGPASFCGSTGGSPSGFLFPPMLFSRNALACGPQACFYPKKRIPKVKRAKRTSIRHQKNRNLVGPDKQG